MSQNRLVISGTLIEINSLRHTPAGIPVMEFRIAHGSQQLEAGAPRAVECELGAVAIGEPAKLMQGAKLGDAVRVEGFLANRGKSTRHVVLHAIKIEFLEGT